MRNLDGRIVHVPQDQGKLDAGIPVLGGILFPGVLQVEGRMLDVVSVRKEQNAPRESDAVRTMPWAAAS